MPVRYPRLPRTPEVCPVCGEPVPAQAPACPECGADHRSGWREDPPTHDGLDIPDPDFNYDEFIRQEFGSPARPPGIAPVWWITAIVLAAAFVAFCLTALL